MYVGAHGTYSSLETVLDAADRLRDLPGARDRAGGRRRPQAGAGGGGRRAARLANVVFVDSVPKREVPSWLARADVCLLPYQDNPLFAGALPNKAFDYLGAARPIIAAAPAGELTAMVERGRLRRGRAAGGRRGAGRRDPAPGGRPRGRPARWARAAAPTPCEHYDRAALAARFVAVVESLA